MMKKFFLLMLITMALAFSACESTFSGQDVDEPEHRVGKRNHLVHQAGTSDAPFSIIDVTYTSDARDTLVVSVRHPSGCEGRFDFYWDGSVALSFPPQAYVVLTYSGACPSQELKATSIVRLDIKDFFRHPDYSDNLTIHVINGSASDSSNDKNTASN